MNPNGPLPGFGKKYPARKPLASRGFPIFALLLFVLLCMIPTGCGKRPNPLTGEVVFEGQPVSGASISLVPNGSKGTVGAGAVGIIKNGRFSIPAKYGVHPGFYDVTIISEENLPPKPGADPSMIEIFSRFPVYVFEYEFQESDRRPHMKIEIPSSKDDPR